MNNIRIWLFLAQRMLITLSIWKFSIKVRTSSILNNFSHNMKLIQHIFLGSLVAGIAVGLARGSLESLGRITGGTDAKVGEAPFIVLFSNKLRSLHSFCAGSIIHSHWVLTAAHCLNEPFFDIIAGLHKLDPDSNEPHVQRRTITSTSSIIRHDKFYSDDFDSYDIGLVFLDQPFNLTASPRVNSVMLPPREYGSISGTATLYGWGYASDGKLPENLQALKTEILDNEVCKEIVEHDIEVTSYDICTEGPSGICLLDSGDPLVRNTVNGVELIGIASWGESPCDSRSSPSVYTRVDRILEWIDTTLATYKHKNKCETPFKNFTVGQFPTNVNF